MEILHYFVALSEYMNFNINQGGVGDQLSPTKCFVTPKKSFGHAPVSPVSGYLLASDFLFICRCRGEDEIKFWMTIENFP